ncbi:MAG: hypothetical protein PHN44_04385 [Candidatus Marinimicrobia bacterium]|nr:hypothetical protein [Candidatus Neomarinimicrobiota bacterium]
MVTKTRNGSAARPVIVGRQREVLAQCSSCKTMQFVEATLVGRRITEIENDPNIIGTKPLSINHHPVNPRCRCGGSLTFFQMVP